MLLLIVRCLVVYAISAAFWKLLRHFVTKSSLDNLPGPASQSFLKGNFSEVFDINGWEFHQKLRENYGGVVRINALFGEKMLYVSDPKALHHIILKDQHVFEETTQFTAAADLCFGKGLLATLGEHHRKQRKMLNPVFSTAHMREMIPIFYEVTHQLEKTLQWKLANGPQEIDVMHWISRTALELIAQSGLGYSIDSLADNSVIHPYSAAVKDLMPIQFKMYLARNYLLPTLIKIGPPKFRRFIVDLLPFKNVRKLRNMIDIMHNTSVEIFESKKRALLEGDEAVQKQIGRGKDIISILMKANMRASEEDKLPESEVLGQMTTLIWAAMDTTSSALSRTLHLLAVHPDIQEKLRQEVLASLRNNGGHDFSYDELVSLPYLDAVCRETLRLYSPISTMSRTAKRDALLPLYTPIKGVNGSEINEIVVPKDTTVLISILNSNRDPALWGPDSYEWKPERWLSPLPETLTQAPIPGIYTHLMSFLGGGRACIGFKFSQLEMKVVLSVLLSRFRFGLSEKEIVWEMSSIAGPAVKGHPRITQMPLIVYSAASVNEGLGV